MKLLDEPLDAADRITVPSPEGDGKLLRNNNLNFKHGARGGAIRKCVSAEAVNKEWLQRHTVEACACVVQGHIN